MTSLLHTQLTIIEEMLMGQGGYDLYSVLSALRGPYVEAETRETRDLKYATT